MKLLIVDTETTGTDPEVDSIIEIAAILYSAHHQTILAQASTLIRADENPAEKVNKINCDSTKSLNRDTSAKLAKTIELMAKESDAIIAHNAEFDKSFIFKTTLFGFEEKPWICSLNDIEWPQVQGNLSLVNIALNFGIPIVSAHRALTDCSLLAAIFDKQTNLIELIEKAMQPKFLYKANVSFEEKHLAKEAGFIWNNLLPNAWSKKMSEEAASKLNFSVTKY
jgi:DNA polymerase-3 subunit epsilon